MRILIVNTSENIGGAAVAANRLMEALNNSGQKAKMLVRDKNTDSLTVVGLGPKWLAKWKFIWERLCIFLRLKLRKENLYAIDIANTGFNITKTREFKEADVIHLHWINQGMLSINDIRSILDSDKPVVWTMHDLWPASSICHYARNCKGFTNKCGRCPLLSSKSANDLSAAVWRKKHVAIQGRSIQFVTCSRWLMNIAKESSLLKDQKIQSIPNAIDTRFFKPEDKQQARQNLSLPQDKKIILFVAQKVSDERKGMSYLIEALKKEQSIFNENCALAVLGGKADEISKELDLPIYPLGFVTDQKTIIDVYNAADVFVIPSLEDNLPNTIMEALACGVPCVGFNVGGIPEMIDHKKNGYVARYKDSGDLAQGLIDVLFHSDAEQMRHEAVKKVAKNYSQNAVALKYTELYNAAIAQKHYNI